MAARGADLATAGRGTELTVLSCHVPVTVRVVGRLGDEKLARLAASVETAVAARLAEAGRTLPDGAVVVHPPSAVGFSGDVAEPDRVRLAEALLAAVTRAAGRLTGAWSTALPAGAGPASAIGAISASGEPLDRRGRPLPDGPLDRDFRPRPGGRRIIGPGEIGPSGEILEGGSPFDGLPLATLRGSAPVLVGSPRHTVAGTLTLAVQFGLVLFPAGSFAVIESPAGVFWTVATEPAVDAAELSAGLLPDAVLASAGTAGGPGSRIRVLITRDRRPVWRDRESGVDWLRRLAAEAGTTTSADGQVPGPVGDHPLLTRLRSIAETELSFADAPSTPVPPADRTRRLTEVLTATPWAEQIRTAMELIAAATDGAYLAALVAALRETGLHGRLFDDPSPDGYDLLRDVGTRFPPEPGPLSVGALAVLLRRFDLLPRRLHEEALLGVAVGPQGITVPAQMLALARESAAALVRAGAALGESITGLFSSPQQQARVREALAQLLVTARLAGLGVRPAVRNLERFLQRLPIELLVAVRGAERLAVPDRTLRRLQWRAILQIAFAYGPQGTTSADGGEVSGDATAVLAAVSAMVRLGVPVNPGVLAARLVTVAGVLAAARPDLGGTDEVVARLAGLPDPALRRLGGVLTTTPVAPGVTLADLADSAPVLHAAAVDALLALDAGGQ